MARRATPEVNAGSMADIAFLLLIFFLVTTTIEKDKGIARQLPPKEPPTDEQVKIKEKNLFIVNVNRSDQLLVEEKLMELKDIRQAAIAFLDNGGAPSGTCLLYTSDAADDLLCVDLGGRRIIKKKKKKE
eukprot:TRINITY_DN3788_c0_g1_i4.p2 TRINITY_DN3788_c0_g1~~TRINITY_DN3788_c0_g1_i4.p2  ORF type:complete len:130 (-),score=17.25 TRINITY_DN3788_c0_g1_i4:118-507(-)